MAAIKAKTAKNNKKKRADSPAVSPKTKAPTPKVTAKVAGKRTRKATPAPPAKGKNAKAIKAAKAARPPNRGERPWTNKQGQAISKLLDDDDDDAALRVSSSVEQLPQDLGNLFSTIRQWAETYAHDNIAGMSGKWSMRFQYDIVDLMEDYCFTNCYGDLHGNTPISCRERLPAMYLATIITRDVVSKFFENPFWYMTPGPDQIAERDGGGVLQMFYLNFQMEHPEYAGLWRALTARLCNSGGKTEAPSEREALIAPRVFDASSPGSDSLKRLFKGDPDNDPQMQKELADIYARAAQLSIDVSLHAPMITVKPTLNLQKEFQVSSRLHRAYEGHNVADGDTQCDGRRVMLVLEPIVGILDGHPGTEWISVMRKANVLLEKDLYDY